MPIKTKMTMFRFTFLLSLFAFSILCCQAQTSSQAQAVVTEEITVIDLEANSKIIQNGNLNTGFSIPLKWAENSSVACFPGTRFNEYMGNHILYRVQMPAAAKINIQVTPKNKKHRINLYALRLGADNMSTPPNITSAISCEASYPIYAGKPNYNKAAKPQSVEYISINKPYTILIGVAGAEGVTEGDFELEILMGSR